MQTLAIEIFKFLNRLSLSLMNEVFQVKPSVPCSLKEMNELYSRNPKTVTYGTESISFLVPRIWLGYLKKKKCKSLDFFQQSIRKKKTNLPVLVR